MIKRIFYKYFELIFWISALVALAFSDPSGPVHYSLCPLKAMGFTWCPGCGLGHSISWLFRGNIVNSWHAHWFGIPALAIILYRIYRLVVLRFFTPTILPTNLTASAGEARDKNNRVATN